MAIQKTIGRYEILSEIGHGAMGVVYLAHDPRIDRRVAIKTIHALEVLPDSEAEEVRQRFTREAQAAGRLQHPGIVTIFDVGEHGGTCYIAMEYIEGDTLEPYAKKGHLLAPQQAIDLIVQACEALDYAHQHHIVHRDIKPANLMLLKSGRLKITDFGLAKNPTTSLTQEGILIGTPNYMSPEQVMGRPLDGRTDLFSLCAVLYELLTGERPFPGDTVTTIIYRILNEQPAPPQGINRNVPPAVGQVLMKALAKEPDQRYQTGADLAKALKGRAVMAAAAGIGASRGMAMAAAPAPARQTAATSRPAPGSGRMLPRGPQIDDRPDTQPIPREVVASARAAAAAARVEPAPLVWPARVKATLIGLATVGLVLLLPAAANVSDRWGLGAKDGRQPFYRTAGIVAGGSPAAPAGGAGAGSTGPAQAGMAPPAVTLPGGTDTISVTWKTAPPGGRIYIDDVEVPGGVMQLPKNDKTSHTVVAESACFIEKVPYRAGADADGATRTIKLATPKIMTLPVASSPPGAGILLDGKETGKLTPAELPVAACGAHSVTLHLEGYKDVTSTVSGGTLAPITMAKVPLGFVKIAAPYALTILENGRTLGRSGEAIRLTGGRHKLVLKNEELFVEKTLDVHVVADKTTTPNPGLPGVGTLTVLTSPGNCAISLNGRDLGAPPINDLQIAAGTYTLRAVYVPTGESRETSVTISAGGGTRVPFKFNP